MASMGAETWRPGKKQPHRTNVGDNLQSYAVLFFGMHLGVDQALVWNSVVSGNDARHAELLSKRPKHSCRNDETLSKCPKLFRNIF